MNRERLGAATLSENAPTDRPAKRPLQFIMTVRRARLVCVVERHRDRVHLGFAEVLEEKLQSAAMDFASLLEIAAPAIRSELARAQDENFASNHFHAFHQSHLLRSEWPCGEAAAGLDL